MDCYTEDIYRLHFWTNPEIGDTCQCGAVVWKLRKASGVKMRRSRLETVIEPATVVRSDDYEGTIVFAGEDRPTDA